MENNIKVVYNNEVYIPLKEAVEQSRNGIKIFEHDGVEITNIPGMGKAKFVKEKDLQQYNKNIKTVVFSVQDKLKDNYKTHFKAAALVYGLMRIEINEEDLINKVKEEAEKYISKTLNWLERNYQEAKQDKEKIDIINSILTKHGSNLRVKQFLSVTDGLKVNNNLFLCGNGYFKKLYSIDNIVIPSADYCNWDCLEKKEREDFINSLNKDNLYVYDEGDAQLSISLKDNYNDIIDYNLDYFNIILQLFKANGDITTTKNMSDWTDFNTADERLEFELEDEDLINIFLLTQGQQPTKRDYNKYDITLEQLESIVKQIKNVKGSMD